MSKFTIVEGQGNKTGSTYYQVFRGGKAIGGPHPSRESAQADIKRREDEERDNDPSP